MTALRANSVILTPADPQTKDRDSEANKEKSKSFFFVGSCVYSKIIIYILPERLNTSETRRLNLMGLFFSQSLNLKMGVFIEKKCYL